MNDLTVMARDVIAAAYEKLCGAVYSGVIRVRTRLLVALLLPDCVSAAIFLLKSFIDWETLRNGHAVLMGREVDISACQQSQCRRWVVRRERNGKQRHLPRWGERGRRG